MGDRSILLNPGPVTLSDRVRSALTSGDWCHREPEFAALTREINTEIARIYPAMQDGFESVFMTASGTGAVEGMLACFAPETGGTLVVANGVYGERMAGMLAAHGRPHELIKSEWTAPLDVAAVRKALDANPAITHVATVHHETTTGRLNDLDALGVVCVERGLSLLLDGVSSFGAEAIDPAGWNLAAVAGTANKCLHGVPGLSFVVARRDLWTPRAKPATGSVYLDLFSYYAGQHGEGFSPFTQSIQVAFALREALKELAEAGGREARHDLYRVRAQRIHAALTAENVSALLADADCSTVLRSYHLPDGVTYPELHDALKKEGFIIYAGQGGLDGRIFRVAVMGDIRDSELDELCAVLKSNLQKRR
jgi:2-aminoethylphosphonate-pyruvate transaminase